MVKPASLVFLIFAVLGSVFVAVALIIGIRERALLQGAAQAEGIVIENEFRVSSRGSGSAHPRIRFRTENGQEVVFRSSMGTSPPAYEVGERVPVLYDPAKPANAFINSFVGLWLLPVIFGSIGLVFSCVGIIPFAWARRVQRRDDWLRVNGRRVQADFEGVERNTSLRVNGQSPWRIVCQWLDPMTHEVHVYRSHNLWFDPSKYITGTSLQVMVDPENPKRYVVETSFLPKLAD